MTFPAGATIVRRYLRGPHVTWAQATRVLADDGSGLLLWMPAGAGFAARVHPSGQGVRGQASIASYGAGGLRPARWQADTLIHLRPGRAHSVWWFFADGRFHSWYVNLESPARRWTGTGCDGFDLVDHHLDVVVAPDRSWRWKDEDEFAAATDQPGFWTAGQARSIRAEGERVTAEVEAGAFPFDGTWCDFRPDPSWPLPVLPASGWGGAEFLSRAVDR